MATQTLILHNPVLLLPCRPRAAAALPRITGPTTVALKPRPQSFRSRNSVNSVPAVRGCSSALSDVETTSTPSLLAGSTRTVTTLLAIAITASKFFADKILRGFQGSAGLRLSIINSVGPAFFAAIGDETAGSLNTPFTVVAAGMAKWLDIYSGVLMVRVLLSWFPNIPWDRQPFSAVRDLCDPYLNLFRNIIPPIFDTLDVSPLLAFAVLGTLGSILKSSRGGF